MFTDTANYRIRNKRSLTMILWGDALLGGSTALIGLIFSTDVSERLGLTTGLIRAISIITFVYAVAAFHLALQDTIAIGLLRALISAN